MKVVPLDESLEDAFWKHVNRDVLDYYFFALDMKLNPDRTKVFLATDGKAIRGLMLVYADYVVQLRGNREAVKLLLDELDLEKVELQAPLDCEDLVAAKFRSRIREEMVLMSLKTGEENIQIGTVPERLGSDDAEGIADLMRTADPSWWGEVTAERIKSRVRDALWLGIRQNGKIVSVGMARLTDFGSNINVAATREQYRNRGFATSIISALVKETLKTSSTVLIHVINDNAPAMRTYSKVGFKPYKTYLSIRN